VGETATGSLDDVLIDSKRCDGQHERDYVAAHCIEARQRAVVVDVLYVLPVVVLFFPCVEINRYVEDERCCFRHIEHAHQTLA